MTKKNVRALQIVTANRLDDGVVVYLGAAGWVERVDAARVASSSPEAEELLAEGQKSIGAGGVIDPVLIEVRAIDQRLEPVRLRERIRALGPTVRLDLGKQAE